MVKHMLAAFMVLAMVSASHANLVENGGFESPVIASGSYQIFSSIPGWTSTMGDGIEIQNHIAGNPYEGNQFVELDSNNNSNMLTQLATTASKTYKLSFEYSARPGVDASSNGIDVYFNGALIDSITGMGGSATDWAIHNYLVTATGSLSILEFRATGISDSLGGYIDDVQVNARANAPVVPEPATMGLFGIGLGLTGLMRRRAKRASL